MPAPVPPPPPDDLYVKPSGLGAPLIGMWLTALLVIVLLVIAR